MSLSDDVPPAPIMSMIMILCIGTIVNVKPPKNLSAQENVKLIFYCFCLKRTRATRIKTVFVSQSCRFF